MTLAERIKKGEAAITRAKAHGRDTRAWETHLAELKQQAGESINAPAWVVEKIWCGAALRAFKVCSAPLEAHLWVIIDPSFAPDGLAVFYADELPILATKTPEQLRSIHALKLAFGPGSRVNGVG